MKLLLSRCSVTFHFISLILLATIHQSKAQEIPFNYLQTVNHLSLVNPSLIGADQQPVVSLNYHRQQIGSIDLVPQYSTLGFQTPLGMSRSNIGATLYNYSRSYFNTNGFWISFAQVVPLSSAQLLRFGISGGGSYSKLDVNIVDPVLENYNQKFNADAQFGVLYENKSLQIGGALTNLLGNTLNNDLKYKNNFYSGYYLHSSYQFSVSTDMQLKPFVAYRSYQTNENRVASAEGSIQLLYKNLLGVGVGWREKSGPLALASFNFKKITFGAAYKIASGKDNAGNGAFEVQMKMFLGKKRNSIAKQKEEEPVEDEDSDVTLMASKNGKDDSLSIAKSPDSKTKLKQSSSIQSETYAVEKITDDVPPMHALVKEPLENDVKIEDSITWSVRNSSANPDLFSTEKKETKVPVNSSNPITKNGIQLNDESGSDSKTKRVKDPANTSPVSKDGRVSTEFNSEVTVPSSSVNQSVETKPDQQTSKGIFLNDEKRIVTGPSINAIAEGSLIYRPNGGDNEIKPGNYVIVQAFRVYDNAMRYMAALKSKGLIAKWKYSSSSLFYYVYLFESNNVDEVRAMRDKLRLQYEFRDSWLLQVQ